ncbi:hypothetical protein OBBRIDRAFT_486709 [Obba rivulosa]|uniref:Uncharacterized protein n=1 Tax=Obba rivulosa TaxID=1052685 RepID=A0A8E2AGP9_9APHY|nr:hypothetical protein OBBRIDRAFT_486709 [Obba rivulosa]
MTARNKTDDFNRRGGLCVGLEQTKEVHCDVRCAECSAKRHPCQNPCVQPTNVPGEQRTLTRTSRLCRATAESRHLLSSCHVMCTSPEIIATADTTAVRELRLVSVGV